MKKQLEYRVVHVGAIGYQYDPFKCFDIDEESARRFMEHGAFNYSVGGKMRLESRKLGSGPKDWKEVEAVWRLAEKVIGDRH